MIYRLSWRGSWVRTRVRISEFGNSRAKFNIPRAFWWRKSSSGNLHTSAMQLNDLCVVPNPHYVLVETTTHVHSSGTYVGWMISNIRLSNFSTIYFSLNAKHVINCSPIYYLRYSIIEVIVCTFLPYNIKAKESIINKQNYFICSKANQNY